MYGGLRAGVVQWGDVSAGGVMGDDDGGTFCMDVYGCVWMCMDVYGCVWSCVLYSDR